MKWSVCFILILLSFNVWSQGDECSSALAVTPGNGYCDLITGTSQFATQSITSCSGGGISDDDVWFSFVANSNEMHILINPSSTYDAVVELFSGGCGGLTSLVCEDILADNGNENIISSGLIPGNTYFIRVYDYGTGSGSNTFDLCLFGVPSPTNDVACSAFALPEVSPSCNYGIFTTVGAGDSGIPSPTGCGTVGYSGGDVWFSVVVPSNGILEVYTDALTVTDGAMSLYNGSCGSLTQLLCDDDAGFGFMPYIMQTGLTPGDTVFIRFWEFGNDNPGTFGICVSSPLNDSCSFATLICDLNGYGGVTSPSYDADFPGNMEGTCCGGPFGTGHPDPTTVSIQNNSWIQFTAGAPTAVFDVEIFDCWNALGLQMQIFEGTNCDGFIPVSNFLETASSQQLVATGLTIGQSYYIVIDGFAGDVCNYTISAESGVQLVEITSSAGTILCPGQSTELTIQTSEPPTTITWTANPGGAFGTGSVVETVTPSAPTTYTVVVTGNCGDSTVAVISIDTSRVVTADFYASDLPASLSNPPISPFPDTLDCEDAAIALWANDSASANGYITPALRWVFVTDAFATIDATSLTIYEDGFVIYNQSPLDNNTILTVWGEYLSPASVYTFDLCETFGDGGVSWEVYDDNNGNLLGSGVMASGNPCETFGPFSPSGTSSWTIAGPATANASLATSDFGLSIFDPGVAQSGDFDITYCWDNLVGCDDCETKRITVVNSHNASWTPVSFICQDDAPIDLSSLIDPSASSTSGSWSGIGVTGSNFDPTGLNGNISISYTVSGSFCNDQVVNNINVIVPPVANTDTIELCDEGGGTAAFDLTSIDGVVNGGSGDVVNWFTSPGGSGLIGAPTNFSSTSVLVYAVVDNGNCTNEAEIVLVVNPVPEANDLSPSLCEDTPGSGQAAGIDLTVSNSAINSTGDNVTWYLNDLVTLVPSPSSHTLNNGDVLFAVVNNSWCSDTASLTYSVGGGIVANNITENLCEDAVGGINVTGYNLTSLDNQVNGGSGNAVTWYVDAGLSSAVITPTSQSITDSAIYYTDVSAGNCSNSSQVNIYIQPLPDPASISLGFMCSYNANVDLSAITPLDNQNTGGTGQWYLGGSSSGTSVSGIVSVNQGDSLYYEITTSFGCRGGEVIEAEVRPQPQVQNLPQGPFCEDSSGSGNSANQNLTALEGMISNGNTFSWFESDLITPVSTPSNVTVVDGILFYAIIDSSGCQDTASLVFSVNSLPNANVVFYNYCEDVFGSGNVGSVDLTLFEPLVSSSSNTFNWFDSQGNVISNPQSTGVNSGDTFLLTIDSAGCSESVVITGTIDPLPWSNSVTQAMCENVSGSGTAPFDLTTLTNSVSSGSSNLTWTDLAGTPIGSPSNVTVSTGSSYLAVLDSTGCNDTAIATFIINPLPVLVPYGSIALCASSAQIDLDTIIPQEQLGLLGTTQWYAGNDNSGAVVSGVQNVADGDQFFYEFLSGDSCLDTDLINIIVEDSAWANILQDTQICNQVAEGSVMDFSSLVLTGDVGGNWSDIGSSGANGTFPVLDFDGVIPGVYVFEYATNSAIFPCPEQSYQCSVLVEQCNCYAWGDLSGGTVICEPEDSISLSVLFSGSAPFSALITHNTDSTLLTQWTDSVYEFFVSGSQATGSYALEWVMDSSGCIEFPFDTTSITSGTADGGYIIADPQAGDVPLDVTFEYSGSVSNSVAWYVDSEITGENDFEFSMQFTEQGSFEVMAVVADSLGCVDTLVTNVITDDPYTIIIPNVFTPNGDEVNDVFYLEVTGVLNVSVVIWSRWGAKLFSYEGLSGRWDGRDFAGNLVPDGTYFAVIEITDREGNFHEYREPVTLIR